MISMVLTTVELYPQILGKRGNKYRKSQAKKSIRAGIGSTACQWYTVQYKLVFLINMHTIKYGI